MFKLLLVSLFFTISLYSQSLSSDDNYQVYSSKNYSIIFTDDYKNEALFIKENLDQFLKVNDNSFGYSFDEKLKIVLISNNIQIPNAFSTQVPSNLGVYYNGGSGMNEYFGTSSWLETLLTHEMCHNYQTNAKKSEISKTLHKYLGNNYMPVVAIAPFFTLPNLLLPTALLEGDSVLNESHYNNGGRLHSGVSNAMKNTLVFNDKINPTRFINDHLKFPYTKEKYIVGGFYMKYLANIYGVDGVNSFFYTHSVHSINPLLLNDSFKKHFNIEFDKSIENFVRYTKDRYKGFNELKPKNPLAVSKDEIYLNKIGDKVYFISTNLKTKKELNIYDIASKNMIVKKSSLNNGKVFKVDDKLYTTSSDFVSSTLYKHALFDENNYPLENTIGKDIKDISSSGKVAYVNIKSSFLKTKLFIDGEFYSVVTSSAKFDKQQNIYYFKQNNKTRELYKNKELIYKFDGYFSKIVDIVDDDIYFIANTKSGATLYKYSHNKIYKTLGYDNIIDATIMDDNNALVVTVNEDGYKVSKSTFKSIESNIYTEKRNLNNDNFTFKKANEKLTLDTKKYNELSNLQFSMLYPSYSYDSKEGSSYYLNALFTDPIIFNMLNIFTYKQDDEKVAGVTYTNERYIPFDIQLLSIKDDNKVTYQRDYEVSFDIYGPLYKKGRNILNVHGKYKLDSDYQDKNPTILSLNHIYQDRYSLAAYDKTLSDIKVLTKEDRGDIGYGINYNFTKQLINSSYIQGNFQYLNSNIEKLGEQKGVKIVNHILKYDKDDINSLVEGVDDDFYTKSISSYTIGFAQSFDINRYFYYVPVSLRGESLFLNYSSYDMEFDTKDLDMRQKVIGMRFDTLFLHKIPLPITVKYIENDRSLDDYKVSVNLGFEF